MSTGATRISVECRPFAEQGWSCSVSLVDAAGSSVHEVGVSDGALVRYAPGAIEPSALVRASFEFLLAREPRGSILTRFELPLIERYFPEYPSEIGGVMRDPATSASKTLGPSSSMRR